MTGSGAWRGVALGLVVWAAPSSAAADVLVDRAVVRFFAPETGGGEQPRFLTERVLAFQARLDAMAERPEGLGENYDERNVRIALDHAIAEEMLAALAQKLIRGSPLSRRPSDAELARLTDDLAAGFYERLGGRERVDRAAALEQLDASDESELLARQALAAFYVDRAVTPILDTNDDQLREVFRTAAHPYRGRAFSDVRDALRRWFVIERLRSAESTFMQGARARMTIVVIP
ncbi:MAG TPA: hypothetical protein VEK07_21850 [Polyangiaceae bacterium]|nr:hypothetical protein [Polyangiaceae bacterium]